MCASPSPHLLSKDNWSLLRKEVVIIKVYSSFLKVFLLGFLIVGDLVIANWWNRKSIFIKNLRTFMSYLKFDAFPLFG